MSQIGLTKWTNMIKSPIVKAIEPTLKDTLQASYFNLKNGLKSPPCNIVEQAGEVLWSGRAPIVSKEEICTFVQTEALVDTIVESVLYSI